MKKILYIATCNIYKRTGGGLATLAYYNAFKLLFPGRVDLALGEENCYLTKEDVIKIPRRSNIKKIFQLFRGQIHRNKCFLTHFLKSNSKRYEICVINGGVFAGDMINLFHKYGIKVVVIHHNFEREYYLDNKSLLTFFGISPFLIVRNERKSYLNSDLNCFLTKSDILLFKNAYGNTTSINTLIGVFDPCEEITEIRKEKSKNLDNVIKIVISGSLNSYQTINGICDFSSNYLPIIIDNINNACVIVAGRDPDESILKIQKKYSNLFNVIPNPPNMDDIVKNADIFCCPTRIGGGLKLRLMDGLKLGIPVIVHEKSARGYDMYFDKPFFKIYNDEKSFKKGILSLISYLQSNVVFEEDMKLMYQQYFSFHSGCTRLSTILKKLPFT